MSVPHYGFLDSNYLIQAGMNLKSPFYCNALRKNDFSIKYQRLTVQSRRMCLLQPRLNYCAFMHYVLTVQAYDTKHYPSLIASDRALVSF